MATHISEIQENIYMVNDKYVDCNKTAWGKNLTPSECKDLETHRWVVGKNKEFKKQALRDKLRAIDTLIPTMRENEALWLDLVKQRNLLHNQIIVL